MSEENRVAADGNKKEKGIRDETGERAGPPLLSGHRSLHSLLEALERLRPGRSMRWAKEVWAGGKVFRLVFGVRHLESKP